MIFIGGKILHEHHKISMKASQSKDKQKFHMEPSVEMSPHFVITINIPPKTKEAIIAGVMIIRASRTSMILNVSD